MFSFFSNPIPQLSVGEVKQSFDKKEAITVLDVRTPEEYHEGHIDGSILVPVEEVRAKIQQILTNKDQKIIVHCRSGGRSLKAVGEMKKLGYTNVYNLQGGIIAWENKGYHILT
jgi:rhodanese-related sulfurtransferase